MQDSLYPRLLIDLKKLEHNAETIGAMCKKRNIDVMMVTKAVCGSPSIASAVTKKYGGFLADSRIKNLVKCKNIPLPKVLLRLPMACEIEDVIRFCDISLNSEVKTIHLLNREAIRNKKTHGIILMIDLGDLREGIWPDQLMDAVRDVLSLSAIQLKGIGVNFSCLSGVLPEIGSLTRLCYAAEEIEQRFKIKLSIISAGNSSSIHLLTNEQLPRKINNLRLGESILFGWETAFGNKIPNTYQDAFCLEAQFIEIKNKPSFPTGKSGVDAFGNKPRLIDRGIRKRGILGIGRQDVEVDRLISFDQKVDVIGSSSDHLLVDLTDSDSDYKVGDIFRFNLDYASLLRVMTSDYVRKQYLV